MDLQTIETLANFHCQQIFNDVSLSILEMSFLIVILLYFALLAMRFLKDI